MSSTYHPMGSKVKSAPQACLDSTLGRSGAPCWLLPVRRSRSTSPFARFLLPYDMSDTPEVIFEKLAAHPGFGMVTIWIGVVLAPTCIAGVVAVAWLSRRRAPILTTIGLILAVVGFTCLAVGSSFGELSTALIASHPEFDRATAYAVGSGLELGAVSNLTGTLFVLGHLIGTVILGLALWRSHAVPSWAALLLAMSQPIHLASVMLGSRPLDLIGWGGTAVGFAAGRLDSAADEQR